MKATVDKPPMGLYLSGRRVTEPVVIDSDAVVGWKLLLSMSPLIVVVFTVNWLLTLPPIVGYREAWRQTSSALFGDDAIMPWRAR